MYGGGNFAPQRAQTSETSVSTSQKLVPPLQPHNLAQQSSLMEKGPPSYPAPLVGQAYHPAYTNDHRGPAPSTGILNSSQSYLAPHSFPPPPQLLHVHGSPMARPSSNPQQDSQWTRNVQQLLPPFPPTFVRPLSSQNGPEILLPPPPPPPRLQPPLLSQGHVYYRGSVLPPLPASVHGIHQTPLAQPPQLNSTPYTHGHFGSVPHTISQDPLRSSTGLLPPPLPPSSPPGPIPLPPPSPPPPSLSAHSGSAELLDSSSIAKISTTNNGSFQDHRIEKHLKVDSLVQHPSSSKDTVKNDLPPPPAKPGKERVARKIEVLCQYIARNGPEFEEMTRKNEFGNPEFQFLFGGSPGSEAATAHEYFLWMKKKCSLSCRVDEVTHHSNSPLRPIEYDALQEKVQPSDSSEISALREHHSPADSNMDIEDEMTEIDDKQKCSESVKHVNGKSDLMCIKHERQLFAKNAADLKQAIASNAAGGVDSETVSAELVTGTSAFKLLQDYASDDNSVSDREHCIQDISPALVNFSGKSVTAPLDGRDGSNFVIDRTTKYSSESERCCGQSIEHAVPLAASIPSKVLDSSMELQGDSREIGPTITSKDKIHDNNSCVNHEGLNSGIRDKSCQPMSHRRSHVRPTSDNDQTQKEDGKYDSTAQPKVDEFGRLVKTGGSDSDSDDLRFSRRHGKRDRSRSRSRSRDRSPRRRRQKRSRSRSWSPKKRRSRSRSPFRRRSQYSSDRTRRDKDPQPACFDYKRGKCYRGASCRYSHCDTTKGDPSRCHRSKYQNAPPSPKKTGKPMHEHDEVKSQEMQLCQDLVGSSLGASKDCNIYQKEDVMSARNIFDKDVDLLISSVAESVRARDAAQIEETQHTRKDLRESPVHHPDDNICKEVNGTPQVVDNYVVTHLADVGAEANRLNQVLHDADHQPQHMDVPCDSQTLPASEAKSNPLSIPEVHLDTKLDQSYPGTGPASMSYSSETILAQHLKTVEPSPKYADQPLQFSSAPLSSLQATQIPLQMPSDCRMFPQISKFQCHSTPSGSFIPHQSAFPNQLTNFSSSPNSAWNSLPPPPQPVHYVNNSKVQVSSYDPPSSQLQENQLPLKNDHPSQVLVGPYPTNMRTHSHSAESHHRTYLPTQDPHRPSSHVENNKSTAMPHVSTMTQQVVGPSVVGDDRLRSLSSHGSLSQGSMHPQPVDMPSGFPDSRMQSFGSNNLHSGELSSSSQRQSHLQQPSNPMHHSTVHVPDFAGSRIPSYYNPYATTFEQPTSSNVGADVFCQAKGMSYSNNHGDPFSSSHVSADGQIVDSQDSKNATFSTNSNQAFEKILPKSSGDQYDPLFDSIELPSKSFRTSSNGENREKTDDSDMILRAGNSYKPLDLAENTKQRESEAVAITSYQDNDEYGETAEAEVGAVENGSPSEPIDEANTAAGEIEIDEVKTSGKGNKGKDSRSMKLFKVALADFVKEVLKPSWRQGNLSKEAFKTIVKKTVDKVSGAMKNHQVPKSQTKINHYIDSSQRKLTKLVMGYVDKYVKV